MSTSISSTASTATPVQVAARHSHWNNRPLTRRLAPLPAYIALPGAVGTGLTGTPPESA